MSHTITIPDELYRAIARFVAERGQAVEELAAAFLAREVAQAETSAAGLDWARASADDIIAALHASRAERHPRA
ncbi:MAG TPA: hypothetical protein VID73_11985 [Ktedonobacterales bacterium]